MEVNKNFVILRIVVSDHKELLGYIGGPIVPLFPDQILSELNNMSQKMDVITHHLLLTKNIY